MFYNILTELVIRNFGYILARLIKMCSNKMYSKVHSKGKLMSDEFTIQNGLKQKDALKLCFFDITLEYKTRNGY